MLHPELTPAERRRLFFEGIERFNRGRYFDSHESWEEIWRSTTPEPRDLFQGLVQIAAGLHHWFDRRRAAPAARVIARGRRRLEPFPATCHGVDLAGLIAQARRWEEWLRESRDTASPAPPTICVLDRAAVR